MRSFTAFCIFLLVLTALFIIIDTAATLAAFPSIAPDPTIPLPKETQKLAAHSKLNQIEIEAIANATMMSSNLIWPVVFHSTVGFDTVDKTPSLVLGFVIPYLFLTLDLWFTNRTKWDIETNGNLSADRMNAGDAQSIISAAFAVGSIVRSKGSEQGNNVILISLLFLMSFVIPNASLPRDGSARAALQTTQCALVNYALGLVVSGITLNVAPHVDLEKSLEDARMTSFKEAKREVRREIEAERVQEQVSDAFDHRGK